MKLSLSLLAVGLMIQTSAFALPFAEKALGRYLGPARASNGCADFSGQWEGECQVVGQSFHEVRRIKQNGCESLSTGDEVVLIKGLKTETYTVPDGKGGVAAVSATQNAHWENKQSELAIQYTGFVTLDMEGQTIPFNGKEEYRLVNGQLVSQADILGFSIRCTFDKK